MINKIFNLKNLLLSHLLILCLTCCFATSAIAEANKNNVATTKLLLNWMQKNLNSHANFSSTDLEQFFASKFIIDTNGKIVKATPATYHEYLYKFKPNIASVHYDVQRFINANEDVIVPFIITIKNIDDKTNQILRVIAIFKFDENGRIIMWQEVFTKI